ncbi:MAG: ABC transporter ATP-binding protein [Chlamydiota bacterium]|nr:ABC transporter ATP-binding protein [Chlamydiota bacterium]
MVNEDKQPVQKIWINQWCGPDSIRLIEDALVKISTGSYIEIDAPLRTFNLDELSDYCHQKGYPIEVHLGSNSCQILIYKGQLVAKTKIVLQGIRKTFSTNDGHVNTFDGIDLDIKEGEFVCIVGPTGCGKSTLLNIIAGLVQADEGTVQMDGKVMKGSGPDRLMIFQEPALFPWYNVEANVKFGLRLKNLNPEKQDELAKKYLQMVHLARFRKTDVHQLSGGMKQRVAIARALALEPDVLLMDEPFSALDEQTKHILHNELQDIWQKTGKTIIFVTHHLTEAICLADRVILLSVRPARIKKQYYIDLVRPRNDEDIQVALLAKQMSEDLKEEIDKLVQEQHETY